MKKWEIISKIKNQKTKIKNEYVLQILLRNRNIKTKKEIDEFLNPKLSKVTVQSIGIDKRELKRAVDRIKKAIKDSEQIIIFGDYDVDGICGSTILWETLNSAGAKVLPYIPHRIDEGYGLSVKGIENLLSKIPEVKLIITVDNGIVANEAVDFANSKGVDVIITDHHVPGKKLPKAFSIVHTTKICGAAVGWILAKEFKSIDSHLELAALATVADLVPLTGESRAIVKFGIENLHKTERVGLLALLREAGVEKESIGTYEIGHVIAPRLNAMGRLESAMDSLRLLCTKNSIRAKDLARKLSSTNFARQNFTQQAAAHAITNLDRKIASSAYKTNGNKLIFIAHESYQQGIIGLVASKLVEEYYLPSIVVSKGKTLSRASARSISGLNIIEFIRSASDLLVDAGGHPMAAGFTVETAKLALLQKKLEELALAQITEKMLVKTLKIDCELPADLITSELYDLVQKLAPFGMGNYIPIFATKMVIDEVRTVGQDNKHLKLVVRGQNSEVRFDAIAFNMGEKISQLKIGKPVEIAYTIDQDSWNGNKKLQLKIKDIKLFAGH